MTENTIRQELCLQNGLRIETRRRSGVISAVRVTRRETVEEHNGIFSGIEAQCLIKLLEEKYSAFSEDELGML